MKTAAKKDDKTKSIIQCLPWNRSTRNILFSYAYLKQSDMPFWSSIYTYFMRNGSACSSFFYVMSGFLAVYTWRNTFFKKYIIQKLKKIYPLTLCVLVLAAILDYAMSSNATISRGVVPESGQWWFNILMGVTMLKAFIPFESTVYSFHGSSWYLSGLIFFYVLAYFIVPKLKGERKK